MKKLTNRNLLLSIALAVLVPLAVLASNLTLPFTFTSGTPIKSSEVNANFTAVQTAVNSKLDTSASTLKSGTRLQVLGFRTTDGLAAALPYSFFDLTLGIFCTYQYATDGTFRCLPSSGAGYTSFYSDSMCSQYLFDKPPLTAYPGWPTPTAQYATNYVLSDAGYVVEVTNFAQYFGPVYTYGGPDAGYACVVTNPGRALYLTNGAVVPITTFAQMNGAVF